MDKISKRIAALVFAAAFVLSIVAASFPAVGAYEVEPESSEGDGSTSSHIDESLLVKDLGLDLHFFCEWEDDAGRTLATLNKEEFPNIGALAMGATMVLEQEPNENLFYSLDVPSAEPMAMDYVWSGNTDKAVGSMFAPEILNTVSLNNEKDYRFCVEAFEGASEDGSWNQNYLLFLYRESDKDDTSYMVVGVNPSITAEMLDDMVSQYAEQIESESDEIIAVSETQDEIKLSADDCCVLAYGAVDGNNRTDANVDLTIPEFVALSWQPDSSDSDTQQGANEVEVQPTDSDRNIEPSGDVDTGDVDTDQTEQSDIVAIGQTPPSDNVQEVGDESNDDNSNTGNEDSNIVDIDSDANGDLSNNESDNEQADDKDSDAEVVDPDQMTEVPETTVNPLLDNKNLTKRTLKTVKSGNPTRGGNDTPTSVSKDGTTIERATIRWTKTGSDNNPVENGFDRLELAPQGEEVTEHQYQVNFSLFSDHDYEPGEIEAVVPAFIWTDRNGNETGDVTVGVPSSAEGGTDFAWRRVNDSLVVTNTKKMKASSQVFFQVSFRHIRSEDIRNDSVSLPLSAVITVTTKNGEAISLTSNTIDAHITTFADIKSAYKTAYDSTSDVYSVYWNSVPISLPRTFLPAGDSNDYVYVRWYVSGTARGSQPFDMTVSDSAGNHGCIILGAQTGVETKKSTDGQSVSARLYSGYSDLNKAGYIWTAYPKSEFTPGQQVTLNNTCTISVKGQDVDTVNSMSATASVQTNVPKVYTIKKVWNDNNNAKQRRPASVTVYIRAGDNSDRTAGSVILTEANNWTATWQEDSRFSGYYVDELTPSKQLIRTKYNDDGSITYTYWGYTGNSTFDSSTNTWTITNTYGEYGATSSGSSVSKEVNTKYESVYYGGNNTALNELRMGRAVDVDYTLSTRLSTNKAIVDSGAVINAVLEDTKFQLNQEETTSLDDVEVTAVIMGNYEESSYSSDGSGGLTTVELDDSQEAPVVLYAYIGDNWIPVARLENGTLTSVEGSGAVVVNQRVNLPAGTAKVKAQAEGIQGIASLSYRVFLRVKATQHVKDLIETAFGSSDYATITLRNNAQSYVTTDGTAGYKYDTADVGYLYGRNYRVSASMEKTFTYSANDIVNKRIKLRATLRMNQLSNVIASDTYRRLIADSQIPFSTGGTFYDLLPAGVMPELSSITLQSGDTLEDAYVVKNYKNSGRTLLVIKVQAADHSYLKYSNSYPYRPAGFLNYITVSFDSYYSYDDMFTNGLAGLRNVAAFEDNNSEIGSANGHKGEPDNPTAGNNEDSLTAVGEDAAIMTNLDKQRDTNSFVYSSAVLRDALIDVRGLSSLQKHVAVDGSGNWSSGTDGDVNVQEGDRYTYRVFVRSDIDTQTSNIIVFDPLEQYQESESPQWKGKLVSVDVSQLRTAGANPVIYYSTSPTQNLSWMTPDAGNPTKTLEANEAKNHLLNDEYNGQPMWTTTAPDDLSTVTAIAIDATKRPDGTDFILDSEEYIAAYVHMQAPRGEAVTPFLSGNGEDPALNAHAHNSLSMSATMNNNADNKSIGTVLQSPTQIGIYSTKLNVQFQWDDDDNNDGIRPTNGDGDYEAKIKLYQNGEDSGLSLTLNEANQYRGVFEHLRLYGDDGERINYTFALVDAEGYTLKTNRVQNDAELTGYHKPETISIPVVKTWAGDESQLEARPEAIQVRLLGDGKFTGQTLTIQADTAGKWEGSFNNVRKYKSKQPVVYTIEEAAITDYYATYDATNITNTYFPYGDIAVSRSVNNGTSTTSSMPFTFTLELKDKNGNQAINKYEYETSDGQTGTIGNGDEFTLTEGQVFTIKDVSTKLTYTITESSKNGFTQVSAENATGKPLSRNTVNVHFVDDYETSGEAQIDVEKTLTGRAMTRLLFRFNLTNNNNELLRTTYNDEAGAAAFGRLKYSNADDGQEFRYSVTEENRGKPGYTYDSHVFTAKVIPHDNGNGTMTCSVSYEDSDGNPVTVPTFHNEYHAQGEISLRAWKVMKARQLEANEFSFRLLDSDEQVIDTKRNAADGVIDFAPIQFTEQDAGNTYHYVAQEVVGDDDTVIYDTTKHGYMVEVIDNGDGTIGFNQTFERVGVPDPNDESEEFPVFTNRLKNGSLSVSKKVDGENPDQNKTFRFKIKLIGDGVEDGSMEYQLSPADGS